MGNGASIFNKHEKQKMVKKKKKRCKNKKMLAYICFISMYHSVAQEGTKETNKERRSESCSRLRHVCCVLSGYLHAASSD